MDASTLKIKNPHSILSVLLTRPQDVVEVFLPKESHDPVWKEIESFSKANRIKIVDLKLTQGQTTGSLPPSTKRPPSHQKKPAFGAIRNKIEAGTGGRESSHGALIRPRESLSVEELFAPVSENPDSYGVWLALDCLQDPQNVGAIFRSASFFGVKGMILTTERSAPITATTYDVASGGVDRVPFCQTINLQRAFEKAKTSNLWILGTSEHAKESLMHTKLDRNWLIVIGNEEKGLRRLSEEATDMMVKIPGVHKNNAHQGVTSLNASVACGVMLSHFLMRS